MTEDREPYRTLRGGPADGVPVPQHMLIADRIYLVASGFQVETRTMNFHIYERRPNGPVGGVLYYKRTGSDFWFEKCL